MFYQNYKATNVPDKNLLLRKDNDLIEWKQLEKDRNLGSNIVCRICHIWQNYQI